MEYGRKRKGVHGKKADPKIDVWGVLDRNSGRLVLRTFEKLADDASRRRVKGPASHNEVLPLVQEWVRPGSIVCSDRLAAYRNNLNSLGYKWHGVNHCEGEFSRAVPVVAHKKQKTLLVHSQGIDSTWRHLKAWLMEHTRDMLAYDSYVLEWQWRHNNQHADRFLLLVGLMKGAVF